MAQAQRRTNGPPGESIDAFMERSLREVSGLQA